MNKLLVSQRQNIKRVVDVAEDLLGYRLNRLNNSLLWTSLNRPGMAVSSTQAKIVHGQQGESNSSAIHEDEAKVILSWIHKLKDSEHPLLKYTRQFDTGRNVENERQEPGLSYQIRSMVVLLIANMFGVSNTIHQQINQSSTLSQSSESNISEVLSKHVHVAEIAETIYTAHMLHSTVVEIPKGELPTLGKVNKNMSSDDDPKGVGLSMYQGNKVATLMGDLLLARCSKALYSLKNARVTEMMSDSIADLAESESIISSARVLVSHPLIPKSFTRLDTGVDFTLKLNYNQWLRKNSLGLASLLQKACFSSLIFSGHEDKINASAGEIGYKIGLALQANKDFLTFENDLSLSPQIDLCSLPVIFQLKTNPDLISSSSSIEQIHEEIRNSSYAKAKTRESLLLLTDDAIRHVSKFSCSSSKLLQDFLGTLAS